MDRAPTSDESPDQDKLPARDDLGDQYESFADDETSAQNATSIQDKKVKNKYGIIYLSYIPEGLNVTLLREIMSQFGAVGRIFLVPEGENKRRKYLEGWIEFEKKRVAKSVAKQLNGTTLQYGRKHCKMNGQMWSIKYLHKFKWAHLTEQLTHDRAVREQKRRFEMSQAKKQVDFYQRMTERSKMRKKDAPIQKFKAIEAKQNRPKTPAEHVDDDLLNRIFKKVQQ